MLLAVRGGEGLQELGVRLHRVDLPWGWIARSNGSPSLAVAEMYRHRCTGLGCLWAASDDVVWSSFCVSVVCWREGGGLVLYAGTFWVYVVARLESKGPAYR